MTTNNSSSELSFSAASVELAARKESGGFTDMTNDPWIVIPEPGQSPPVFNVDCEGLDFDTYQFLLGDIAQGIRDGNRMYGFGEPGYIGPDGNFYPLTEPELEAKSKSKPKPKSYRLKSKSKLRPQIHYRIRPRANSKSVSQHQNQLQNQLTKVLL